MPTLHFPLVSRSPQLHILFFYGKFDPEGRSFSHITLHLNLAIVALDNSITDRQSQPCSLTRLFGREERGKEFGEMFFAYATSCIHEGDLSDSIIQVRLNSERTTISCHRVSSIDNDVHENLLDLICI